MAKFVPVCPPRIYKGLLEDKVIGRESTLLWLAHDVVAHKAEYLNTFVGRDMILPKNKVKTIIMDNSVVELGEPVSAEIMNSAVDVAIRCADEVIIVLADIIPDGKHPSLHHHSLGVRSYAATLRSYHELWLVLQQMSRIPTNLKFMILPQGDSIQDWIDCYKRIIYGMPTENIWVGIPRNVTGRIAECRAKFVDVIQYSPPRPGVKTSVHLFGFSDDVLMDIYDANYSKLVVSIDSAVPFRQTSEFSDDPGPRGDWWDTCTYNSNMGKMVNRYMKAVK